MTDLGGFKVNRGGSFCGSQEIHRSLLSFLLSENIPDKGHGIHNSRQLFQNGVLGISQVDWVTDGSSLKVQMWA